MGAKMPVEREANEGAVSDESVADPRRVIRLNGACNFRDIGGYRTCDGGRIHWRRVFRSGKLCNLTPEDQEPLRALKIRAVVDLRSREERQLEPSLWGKAPAHLYESKRGSVAALQRAIRKRGVSVEAAISFMTDYYAKRPIAFAPEYRAIFAMLAAGRWPMLIHCSAGKDRTGTACALLLTALGVPREIVIADYILTSALLPVPHPTKRETATPFGGRYNIGRSAELLPEVRASLWEANPAYIAAALDSVDREFGSIHAYLRDGLRLSEREIQGLNALVER